MLSEVDKDRTVHGKVLHIHNISRRGVRLSCQATKKTPQPWPLMA